VCVLLVGVLLLRGSGLMGMLILGLTYPRMGEKVTKVLLVAIAARVFVLGCSTETEEETPVEKAEEEAGAEEIAEPAEPAEPSPEEIQAEGCPEGQVSNEAGTECYPEEEAERAQEQIEQAIEDSRRQQAEERRANSSLRGRREK
jgi:hypothetical protein